MSEGILYGVGVGPGDKELLTLKALRVLKSADIIAAPIMKSGTATAYDIIKDYVPGKEVVKYCMPMMRDTKALDENYLKIANDVEGYLDAGKSVAFVTLGDVSVYSTYMRIDRIIRGRGHKTELIPGITSFSAAAARLGESLCEREEPLVIIPAGCGNVEKLLDTAGTRVLMKAGRHMDGVLELLRQKGLNAVMVERCGMDGERIRRDISEADGDTSYFSIIIAKEVNHG